MDALMGDAVFNAIIGTPAFGLAGQTVTWLEVVAFASGLASVWLTWRLHVASWPIGLINVVCFMFLFVGVKLYADALLQVAFFALGLYGWWSWSRARARAQAEAAGGMRATRAGGAEIAAVVALGLVFTGLAAWVLSRFTDSPAPVPDGGILVFSLAATWLQARRRIESWVIWIVVDVVSIPLYWSRGLPLTAVLYGLFLLICIAGLVSWRQRLEPAA